MRTIEQFQIRKIYAIGNALGITDSDAEEDELHILIGGMTAKDSIKSLTYKEARDMIARLEELQGRSASSNKRVKKSVKHEERPGGVTAGQQKKIWALMYELKKHDKVKNDVQLGERLCAVIKKELHTDAMTKNPFAWLDFDQGNSLIEKLKKYVASARKKGGAEDGNKAG